MRRHLKGVRLLIALLAIFGLVAAACSSDDDKSSSDNTSTTAGSGDSNGDDKADGSDIRVGMVYDVGGRGDLSFNDAAYAGLAKAEADFGIEAKDLEPKAGGEDRAELLRLLADEGYDYIVAVGFAFEDTVKDIAPDYPDTIFAVVDGAVEEPNVKSLLFAEEEGSFLVGAAAALTSETGHVGYIGGVELPLIQKFEAGFVAGAREVNPDIKIDVTYITQPPDFGGFNDPARASEIASSMFEDGADVIYHAAGGSGGGLFEAAYSLGDVWAIGVDSDQYLTVDAPQNERILTSMLKKVDVAVYAAIEAFVNGDHSGGTMVYSLEDGGVDYSTSGDFITDIIDQLEELKAKIVDGSITVPSTP